MTNAYKHFFAGGALFLALCLALAAPAVADEVTDSVDSPQVERRALEDELAKLEEQMAEQEKLIGEYQSQGKTLKGEISQLDARVKQLNLQIEAVTLSLKKLDGEIAETQRSINTTQNRISGHKDALAAALRELYVTDRSNLLAVLLQNTELSEFFGGVSDILRIQDGIRESLTKIVELRQELISQKEELSLEKEDVENLKAIRERSKSDVTYTKGTKQELLETTKSRESKYQELLAATRKTAAEIRSRIFRLIGGGELTFEAAYDLAKLAEGATGVRAALTLAILDRESLLGKNVGRCTYEAAMHPTRDLPVFLAILKMLGIEPASEVAKVSCANQHGSYGGAMGPAQFIPSTWAIYGGYVKSGAEWAYERGKDSVASVTGNSPSNPWNNSDAFSATALYIKDLYNSQSCVSYGNDYDHLLPKQTLQERCAAAKYYAGSRWWTYRFWYGDEVVKHADELQKDIAILKQG